MHKGRSINTFFHLLCVLVLRLLYKKLLMVRTCPALSLFLLNRFVSVPWDQVLKAMYSLSCTFKTARAPAVGDGPRLGKLDSGEKCRRWSASAEPGHKTGAFPVQNEHC